MILRKIIAIIREGHAERVETRLRKIGVPGVSCTHVRGYGEYADYYCEDPKVMHMRFEIYASESQTDEIVHAIMDEARTGTSGDGIVAVSPVEHLYHIRSGKDSAEPN